MTSSKLQYLFVSHLLKEGQISLTLPGGMVVSMGVVQEGKDGYMEKADNYSWVVAKQNERTILMDSYNLGLRYTDENGKIIVEEEANVEDGKQVRIFTAV